MLRVFALLSILFFASITDSYASSDKQLSRWQEAMSLYDAGKYEEAFQSMTAQPAENDPTYFYNLGTIAYRLGRTGAALGYFEKANRLRRHDPDIRHNLELVRADLGRTIGADKLDPASTWAEGLSDHVSLEELRGILGLMGLILAIFWLRTYSKNRNLKATLLRPAALIGSTALLVAVALYWVESIAHSRPPAVALSRQVVRSGPGENFSELGHVDGGAKVRLLGPSSTGTLTDASAAAQEKWFQVRFGREGIGWVRSSGFLIIN